MGLLEIILKPIFKKSTAKMEKKMEKDPEIQKAKKILQKKLGGMKL